MVFVALATLVRAIIDPLLGSTAQFVTFFVAIVLAGAIGGRGPALAATIMSTLSVSYFFIEPRYALWFYRTTDGVAVLWFLAGAAVIAWIAGRLHNALHATATKTEALRQSEEQLRLAILAAQIGIWSWIPGTHHVTVSANWRRLYGIRENEPVTFETWGNSLHPEDRERTLREIYRAVERHEEFNSEYRVLRPDGTVRWITDRGKAWYNAQGHPMGMAGVNMDITDRQRSQEIIRESERQFRSAFQNALVGMTHLDREGRWLLVNETFRQMIGYSCEALVGTEFTVVTHPDDVEKDREQYRQLMIGQMSGYAMEKRYIRKDGQILWASLYRTLQRDEAGQPAYSTAVVVDITEQKLIQEALQQNEERLRGMFDNAAMGIVEMDVEGRFVTANEHICRILGYRCEELQDLDVHALTYPEDRPLSDDLNARLAAGELNRLDYEKRYLKADGSPIWVHVTVSPLRDAQGRYTGAIGTVDDITERKQAEVAVQRRNAVLEGVNRVLKTALTSGTEQELGTVCLEVAESLTQSKFGFIGRINEQGLEDIAISNPGWDACKIIDAGGHRRPPGNFKVHGLYGKVLSEGRSLIANDPACHPDRIGLPSGHPPLTAFLGVPLIREGQTLGMIGVGNRDGGYSLDQQEALEALAPAIVEAFLRKRAEESLRMAHERTETILRSISDAFFALDHKWRFTYVNAETERQLHKSATVLLGNNIWDVFPGAEEFQRRYEQALSSGQATHFEAYYAPMETWFEVHAYPSPDGLSVYFRNVNDRKRAEQALRDSESFYRQTLESIPGMVFTTRPDGYCDYQSQQWVDFTGVPMREHLGSGWNKLLHPEDRQRTYEAWQAAVGGKAPYDLEYRVRRHDGQYCWFRVIGRPIRNAEGKVIRWFGVALDIEQIKRAEDALRRFNEELERQVKERTGELKATVEELQRSNADLEQFAYISSHDLQEPLRMVASYVGLLEHRYKDRLDEEARKYIGFAVEGSIRMSNLIKDLLAYSRVTSQGREPEAVDANAILNRALASLKLRIEETGATIRHEKLPIVQADPTQLMQVFQNLIENALKYRKDNEPPVIRLFAEQRDGQWLFCITDNGIGIRPEYHEQIFVPFKRLHANRSKYPGTGIGLAIVKRIIERHHGRVCVDSQPGKGSTFYFTLPIGNQESDETSPA